MKPQKKVYPFGYAIAVRINGLRTYNEIGQEIIAALPRFADMRLPERLEVWKTFAAFLHKRKITAGKLRRYFSELRIDLARRERQSCRAEDQRDQLGLLNRIRRMELTPAAFKYDRAVGIEIECYGPRLGRELPHWAREKDDGSLSSSSNGLPGVEFNLLLKREYLEPRLFKFCQLLANCGHKVNRTCGLHVHLDMRGKSEEYVAKLAKKLDRWLYALRELVPASRRENQYAQFGFSNRDRYHAVNFTAYAKFRTLEVRLHSGSCDYTKIVSWLRLCELLCAMPKGPKAGAGCLALLESIPLPAHELAYWLARHRELNPALYNTVVTTPEIEN